MKKILQRFALCAILACFLGIAAGCGIGDNFEGTWVGVNRSVGFPQDMIVVRKIAKNGSGYVVSGKRIWLWNTTVTDKTAKLEWRVREINSSGASAKDNILTAAQGMGERLTYVESDKSLQVDSAGDMAMPHAVLHKVDDGDAEIEKLKEKLLAEYKEAHSGWDITMAEEK